jgi:hypothetical protein
MKYIYEVGNTVLGSRICEIDSDDKVSFWSFSELKEVKPEFFKTDKRLKSFLRTRKWALKHYPELLL